ncbi:hypothetical protein WKW50_24690 [Ochrobactrum sp. GPK 3]|uniref:hypothetical protein n=1 Tax=Brucella sp. 22210 TaxID=3453892 RepID=UPI0031385A7E
MSNEYRKDFLYDTIEIVNKIDEITLQSIMMVGSNKALALDSIVEILKGMQKNDPGNAVLVKYINDTLGWFANRRDINVEYNASTHNVAFQNLSVFRRNWSNVVSVGPGCVAFFTLAAAVTGIVNSYDVEKEYKKVTYPSILLFSLCVFIFGIAAFTFGWKTNHHRLSWEDVKSNIDLVINIVELKYELIKEIRELQTDINSDSTMIDYVIRLRHENPGDKYTKIHDFLVKLKTFRDYDNITLPSPVGGHFNPVYFDIPWKYAGDIKRIYNLYKTKQLGQYEWNHL